MNLFIFGLGYSARRFLATQGATLGLSAAGTVRGRDKARALQAEGIETYVFGPDAADAEIPAALAKADALLLTAPPSSAGDPALAAYGEAIAAAPHLGKILYLSTVAVYGDHDGGWVDTSRGKPLVQVQRPGSTAWETLGPLDDYPATTATKGDHDRLTWSNRQFTLKLAAPVTFTAVRVVGTPACGDNPDQAFSSCAELQAFRD